MKPYFYTNRQGKVHYFRAVKTKKGKYRYYVTSSKDFDNLIHEIPEGYEVAELPEDAKVVIRKQKTIFIHEEEQNITSNGIEQLSDLKDFFLYPDSEYLYVYHSQFNYIAGQDENLSKQQAMEVWGKEITRWMRFFTAFRFQLVDEKQRLFQAQRVVFTGAYGHTFHPVGSKQTIDKLVLLYAPHLGRASFFNIEPNN